MAGKEPTLLASERILIITPDRDSPPKKDFLWAFKPESESLVEQFRKTLPESAVKLVRVEVPVVDGRSLTIAPGAKQVGFERAAQQTLRAIVGGKWTRIVMMCHGWDTGIQLGFRTAKQKGRDTANFDDLCSALGSQPHLKSITLFACSAGDEPRSAKSSPGSGDHSFADVLRDRVGCTVIAHWTTGHTTRNPDLILFRGSPVPLIGGVAWPERGTPAYRNAVRLLTNRKRPRNGRKVASGDFPPIGHKRTAFANIVLCTTIDDLQALLSSEPAF